MADIEYNESNKSMILQVRMSIKRNFEGINFGPSNIPNEKKTRNS